MKFLLLLLSLAVLFSAVPGFAQATEPTKGLVVDQNGSPVAGAKVCALVFKYQIVKQDPRIAAETLSGVDGSFSLQSLAVPKVDGTAVYLVAYQPGQYIGWCPFRYGLRYSSESLADDTVKLVIRKVSSFEGRVIDASGKPIPGARITANDLDYSGSEYPGGSMQFRWLQPILGSSNCVTDDKGGFRLPSVPQGASVGFSAVKAGYAPSFTVSAKANERVLVPGAKIIGRVVDENGKPVPNAMVASFGGGYNRLLSGANIKTDKAGRYVIKDIPAGQYTPLIVAPDALYGACDKAVSVSTGKTAKASDIVARKCMRLMGRVTDEDTKKPVSGFSLGIHLPNALSRPVKTNANGEFSVLVSAGSVRIYSADSREDYPFLGELKTLNVAKNNKPRAEITIKKPAYATLKVTDESGTPVPGAIVSNIYYYGSSNTVKTENDGTARVPVPPAPKPEDQRYWYDGDVKPGVLRITVTEKSRGLARSVETDRQSLLDGNLVIQLKPLSKMKVIVKDTSGKPVEGASISASTNVWARYYATTNANLKTDANGEAVCSDLYVGSSCGFQAKKSGFYCPRSSAYTVGSDNTQTAVLVVFPATRVQRGKVVDSKGHPVAGASVYCSNGTRTVSDSKGEFVLEGLPDCDMHIGVQLESARSYGDATASINTKYLVVKMQNLTIAGGN